MNRLLLPLLALLFIMLAGVSCKTTRGHVKSGSDSPEYVLRMHEDSVYDFETLYIKGKGKYNDLTNDESINFTYRILLDHDTLIWGLFTKFGIEGGRMLITDSVSYRNTIGNQVIFAPMCFIGEKVGLDLDVSLIEDLIVGNPLLPGEELKSPEVNPDVVKFEGKLGNREVEYSVSRKYFKLKALEAHDELTGEHVKIVYDQFRPAENQLFPWMFYLYFEGEKEVTFEMEHHTVEVNGDQRYSFNIPDDYERIYEKCK